MCKIVLAEIEMHTRPYEVEAEAKQYFGKDVASIIAGYHESYGHKVAVAALEMLPVFSVIDPKDPEKKESLYPCIGLLYRIRPGLDFGEIIISREGEDHYYISDTRDELGADSNPYGTKQDVLNAIFRRREIAEVRTCNMLDVRRDPAAHNYNTTLYHNDPVEPSYDPERA